MTGPTATVRRQVWERDAQTCQWCGRTVYNTQDYSLQHRIPRGMGGVKGDRRQVINGPQNLILMHGTGTTGCHGYVESNRLEALDRGFLVLHMLNGSPTDPCAVPVTDWLGRAWWLAADGTRKLDGGDGDPVVQSG